MRLSRRAIAVAGIALSTLSGCGKHYWHKPGAGQAEFTEDSRECARDNALYQGETKEYGVVLEDRYKACLTSRGWIRGQHRTPPPNWFRGIEGHERVEFDTPPAR